MMGHHSKQVMLLVLVAVVSCCNVGSVAGQTMSTSNWSPFQDSKFQSVFQALWSESNVAAVDGGSTLQLSLDQNSGTALSTSSKYLFGYLRASIKLMSGNSAGTVTTFYLSSQGSQHDEVDFEFLGNVTGQPYILQTNVFADGVGGREQRIFLPFDPSADYHYYSVIWNRKTISMYVDEILIRVFQNNDAQGQPYLNRQPMGVYTSIFDGSNWATRGGLDKVDYSQAPFNALYTNFTMDACEVDETNIYAAPCVNPSATNWWNAEAFQTLPADRIGQMDWLNQNYMVYNYCTDRMRYPTPPFECTAPLT